MVGGYYIGHCRYRIFPSSQKVLLDDDLGKTDRVLEGNIMEKRKVEKCKGSWKCWQWMERDCRINRVVRVAVSER